MEFFTIEPEVAGWMGDSTILDSTVHPPRVENLHYEFQGWMGDAIVEAFPCFVITRDAERAFRAAGFTGADFAEVETSTSEDFALLQPETKLPEFVWLKPTGVPRVDDISAEADGRLVVSRRVLELLRTFGLNHAVVTPSR